jgi:hypothetical protein
MSDTETETVQLKATEALLRTGRYAGVKRALLYGTYVVLERDRWGEPTVVRSTVSLEEWELIA